MKYSEEQKKEIFHEWAQTLISKGKACIYNGLNADEIVTTFDIDDASDNSIEAEIKITVRKKGVKNDSDT